MGNLKVHEAQARVTPGPNELMAERHAAAKRTREEKLQKNESDPAAVKRANTGERGNWDYKDFSKNQNWIRRLDLTVDLKSRSSRYGEQGQARGTRVTCKRITIFRY